MVERQSLALMDRHRPGRTQRNLLESAVHNPLNLTGFLIQSIADVLPFLGRNFDSVTAFVLYDQLRLDLLDSRDLSVVVARLAGSVVAHEHHLRPDPQTKLSLSRIGVFRKYSFDLCLESRLVGLQGVHFRLVDRIRLRVMGRETDPSLILRRNETRVQPLVQLAQSPFTRRSRPHLIQNVKEYPVALPVDLLQLDRYVRQPLQHLGIEEERR